MSDQFYITLPSNSLDGNNKFIATNKLSEFRVSLPQQVRLDPAGAWELSLVEMCYPHEFNNVNAACFLEFSIPDPDAPPPPPPPPSPQFWENATVVAGTAGASEVIPVVDTVLQKLKRGETARQTARCSTTMEKVYKVTIPPSFYETPTELFVEIRKALKPLLKKALRYQVDKEERDREIQFNYDKTTRLATIVCLQPILWLDISQRLYYMLGLDGAELSPAADEDHKLAQWDPTKETWFWRLNEPLRQELSCQKLQQQQQSKGTTTTSQQHVMKGKYPVDLRMGFEVFYVYCDLVELQMVGNSLVPLLRVVNVEGKHNDIVLKSYENPNYLPVSKREFDSIEINIKDNTNHSIQFLGGQVIVKLHFRKRKTQL